MFTGLIAGTGEIAGTRRGRGEARLMIRTGFELENFEPGESIAVNGACLTAERGGPDWFEAYASAETLSRTNLGQIAQGTHVNLERALRLGDRLGGHLVSGHVDCLARVAEKSGTASSVFMRISFPCEYGAEVISKGSVALNGISLTINDCGRDFLSVNIIPDTQKRTTLPLWRVGDLVNMETDMIGKYVRRLAGPWREEGISRDFLLRNGFA